MPNAWAGSWWNRVEQKAERALRKEARRNHRMRITRMVLTGRAAARSKWVRFGAGGTWNSSPVDRGMAMLRRLLFGFSLGLYLGSCSEASSSPGAARALPRIESIHVDYHHIGRGSFREEFTIALDSSDGGFVLGGRYVDAERKPGTVERKIEAGAVQKLVAAASAPAWSRLVGVRAVAATVDLSRIEVEPARRSPPRPCTRSELLQLARAYMTRKGSEALVDEHYGRGLSWTEDYPHARLQINFKDAPPLRLYSESQKAMMLPWYPGPPAGSPLGFPVAPPPPPAAQNWSLPLSRALRGIVPRESRLHERLGAERLPQQLSRNVAYAVDKECDALGAKRKEETRNSGRNAPSGGS